MNKFEKLANAAINSNLTTWGAWYNEGNGWRLLATSIVKEEVSRKAVALTKASGWKTKVKIDVYHLSPETVAFQEYMSQPAPRA